MTGTVKNIIAKKNFGFIRDSSGIEYFFHREEFNGHWSDLEADVTKGNYVKVEFEKTDSPKGLRAVGVYRTEFPDAGR